MIYRLRKINTRIIYKTSQLSVTCTKKLGRYSFWAMILAVRSNRDMTPRCITGGLDLHVLLGYLGTEIEYYRLCRGLMLESVT